MKFFSLVLFGSIGLVGCASGIHGYDVSRKNQVCVRDCTATYSSCASQAYGSSAYLTLNACESGYRVCSNSCPDK